MRTRPTPGFPSRPPPSRLISSLASQPFHKAPYAIRRLIYFITRHLPIYFGRAHSMGLRSHAIPVRCGRTGGGMAGRKVAASRRGSRLLLPRLAAIGEVAHHHVEDRREQEAEQGDAEHAEEHG